VVGGEIGHGGCTPSTTAPDGLIIGFTSMKLLLFIPCCDKKECRKADQVGPPTWITQARLPGTWSSLVAGRQRRGVQDNSTGGFRASAAYCGLLYSKAQRLGNCRRAHITVISAGYGVVGADDPIYDYNWEMKTTVAREWQNLGLQQVIVELITTERPTDIVGFFAGKSDWNPGDTSAKYRWFYEEGVRLALRDSHDNLRRAVTVFNRQGQSQSLSGLGRVLDLFLGPGSGLSSNALNQSLHLAKIPKNVKLDYTDLTI
jgi:hypothetical protein